MILIRLYAPENPSNKMPEMWINPAHVIYVQQWQDVSDQSAVMVGFAGEWVQWRVMEKAEKLAARVHGNMFTFHHTK